MRNLTSAVDGSGTLYAQWTANTSKVIFDKNLGTGTMADQAFTYDVAQNLTATAFTRVGYVFTGWNDQADGSGNAYTNSAEVINLTAAVDGSVTLYAQWPSNSPNVLFV